MEISIFWLFAPMLLVGVITILGVIFDPVPDRLAEDEDGS